MSIEIPDRWLGKLVEGALERALQSGKNVKSKNVPTTPAPSKVIQPTTVITDPENWIVLEGRTHGAYSYPDLMVSMHRLGLTPQVESVAQALGYTVQNTARDKDGNEYIGNINWEEALKINASLGNLTLNPRQGLDFLIDMREAFSGKSKKNKKVLYDGNAKPLDLEVIKKVYNEIVQVREPWRAEWLDAKFIEQGGVLSIHYGHKLTGTDLVPSNTEVRQPHLMDNDYIDLQSANNQGLPTKNSRTQTLYFWNPSNGTVARFDAGSGGAVLSCYGGPADRVAGLGVRPAREKN
ncbi:MAG: hypothetical protein AABW89_03350 [Nanoarchaeota archaeon]